jgi:DNA sulfur modification protein DndC
MNDTGVENPIYEDYARSALQAIEGWRERERLRIVVHIGGPANDQTFWVNCIGRGYRAPTRHFRWCTDRMKVRPTAAFFSGLGGAVVFLGKRREESQNRERQMASQASDYVRDEPGGMSYAIPIADLSTDEVWQLLLQSAPPWGGSYRPLWTLYRNATGECPFVISEDDAPSCGSNSARFGCWVCTVVQKDRSAQALADGGEDALEPLLAFREFLREISEDLGMRDTRKRNGQPGVGPFRMEVRRDLLRRLLALQADVGRVLIRPEEIQTIYAIWEADGERVSLEPWERELSEPLTLPALPAGRGMKLTTMTFAECVKAWPIQPEHVAQAERYQRDVGYLRAQAIGKYVGANPETYVLPPITCTLEGSEDGDGTVTIRPASIRMANDGQHRIAAMAMLMERDRAWGSERVGVLILPWRGVARAAQAFADLNSGKPVPKALRLALEQRAPSAARAVMHQWPFLGVIETDAPNPKRSSPFLWSLSAMDATDGIDDLDWWREVLPGLPGWAEYHAGKVAASSLRARYLWCHGVGLKALGKLRGKVAPGNVWCLPWLRSDPRWIGSVINERGGIVASSAGVTALVLGLLNAGVSDV